MKVTVVTTGTKADRPLTIDELMKNGRGGFFSSVDCATSLYFVPEYGNSLIKLRHEFAAYDKDNYGTLFPKFRKIEMVDPVVITITP